jgi:hypothetical protein
VAQPTLDLGVIGVRNLAAGDDDVIHSWL